MARHPSAPRHTSWNSNWSSRPLPSSSNSSNLKRRRRRRCARAVQVSERRDGAADDNEGISTRLKKRKKRKRERAATQMDPNKQLCSFFPPSHLILPPHQGSMPWTLPPHQRKALLLVHHAHLDEHSRHKLTLVHSITVLAPQRYDPRAEAPTQSMR